MRLVHSVKERADGRKVRYAVVGAGWIAQENFMPGVAKTGNSMMPALVTGDARKEELPEEKAGSKTRNQFHALGRFLLTPLQRPETIFLQ